MRTFHRVTKGPGPMLLAGAIPAMLALSSFAQTYDPVAQFNTTGIQTSGAVWTYGLEQRVFIVPVLPKQLPLRRHTFGRSWHVRSQHAAVQRLLPFYTLPWSGDRQEYVRHSHYDDVYGSGTNPDMAQQLSTHRSCLRFAGGSSLCRALDGTCGRNL
jgi:hypothetical protein